MIWPAPRVVCMCPLGPPVTGQSRVSDEVLRYLRDNGYVVSVINKRTVPGWGKTWDYLMTLPRIVWCLLFLPRVRLAYLTCSRSRGGFVRDALFIALCRLRGLPALNHVHGSDLPQLLQDRVFGWLVRWVLNGLSANVVLTHAIAVDCERAGLANVSVVRNFADPAMFDIGPSRRDAKAPVRIVYLSNVMHAKGVFDLIAACQSLAPGSFELHIVGYVIESDPEQLQRTIDTLLQRVQQFAWMTWHGPLYREDKLRAYAEADIYCLPSHNEAAPLALMEAMAAGCACVVTRVGGVPEMVTDHENALVVPPQQPAVLAERLRELIDAPALRQQLGERAREHARQHFRISRFRDELGQVVRDALNPAAP